MMQVNYRKQLGYLILFTSVIKLVIAGYVELGNDEVYYWTYAIQPDLNHFDHPPMVGLLIRLTTLNLHWANDISMRLGAIIGCGISSWLLFETGKLISNERTGWYAALLYQCTVYTTIVAGLFILPDSPQMPFWTASLYLMCYIIFSNKEKNTGIWLLLGLLIGLASLSKVHGLYLWAGFGLFILIKRSRWLLNYRLYLAVLLTLLCLVPIVYWNIQNNFITYKFHSERVTHTSLQWDSLLQEIIGEFAYQNPVVFILEVIAIIYFLRHKRLARLSLPATWLLCMSVPMILLFWSISLFNPTLPHWNGPAYIPLLIISAKYLEVKTTRIYPVFTRVAGTILLLVLLIAVGLVQWAPFNIGKQDKENYGEYCPTLDISGWKDFSQQFDQLVKQDFATGAMKAGAPIIAGKWFPAGHLEFYTSRVTGLRVLGIGPLEEVHKFAWLNKERAPLHVGDDAYCIVPSNVPFDVQEAYGKYFTTINQRVVINQVRGGKVVRYFYIYRLKNCKEVPPMPL